MEDPGNTLVVAQETVIPRRYRGREVIEWCSTLVRSCRSGVEAESYATFTTVEWP